MPIPRPTPASVRRAWAALAGGPQAGRLGDTVRRAEMDGLVFAFRARAVAILAVTAWLVVLVPWPRDGYYVAFAAVFFLLGYVPYRLRGHRHAARIKLGFVLLDVALVSVAILMPPPAALGIQWPVQTRLRGQEFLYLLLLLAEAALTYAPLTVLWTGGAIAAIWSFGVNLIYERPDTLRFRDVTGDAPLASDAILRTILDPAFVGLTQWRTQIVATVLVTGILAIAVWRSRLTLLAQVRAEVVRADLARYVSPDVADALAAQGPYGFGAPATRVVTVLFADIVGFTAATEALTPERTFALLHNFQARSAGVVFAHGGTLDKYLGDGFMATFGALGDSPDAADRALACAFALQAEIARWNAKRAGRGMPPVRVGVGVHCGPVVVGNLGGERRLEFTVVGDVVNVASRLQGATREVGCAILASAACVEAPAGRAWAERFASSRELSLRGRERAIRVYVAPEAGVGAGADPRGAGVPADLPA